MAPNPHILRRFIFSLLSFPLAIAFRLYPFGIRNVAARRLPEQFRVNPLRKGLAYIVTFVASFFVWGITLPIVLGYFYYRLGTPPLDVVSGELVDAIRGFSAVPLALVGLVIPILALSINVTYSKMGFSAIRRAFKTFQIFQLIVASLLILLIEHTVLFFCYSANVASTTALISPNFSAVLLLCVWWWTITLITIALFRTVSVLRGFNPQVAFRSLTDELVKQSLNSLKFEMIRNVSLNSIESLLEGTCFKSAYFAPEKGRLFISKSQGLVDNLNLAGLRLTSRLIRKLLGRQDIEIQLATPFHYLDMRDLQLGSSLTDLTPIEHRAIQRLLRAVFRVKKLKSEHDPLLSITQDYKEGLANFVRQDSEVMIQLALEGYGRLFKEYINLGVRLRSTDHPGMITDWRPIMLSLHDLLESIKLAVTNPNASSPATIAHWIMEQMRDCVRTQEEYLFSRLLNLFGTMFYRAARSSHAAALELAHSQPLHILDYELFRFGKTQSITLPLVESRCRMANLIIEHFYALLRTAIDLKSDELINKLLKLTSPDELLAHFYPDIPYERYEIQAKLRAESLQPAERQELEEQLRIITSVDEIKSSYPTYRRDTIHSAAEYLLQRLAHRASSPDEIRPIFEALSAHMGDWNSVQDWFEGRQTLDDLKSRSRWEYWPDTRQGFSSSPVAITNQLFTIRCLAYQSISDTPLIFRPTRAIDIASDSILQFAAEILTNDDWRWARGSATQQTVDMIRQGIDQAKAEYKRHVRESIRQATLDEEAIQKFDETARKEFLDDRVTLNMLSALGRFPSADSRNANTKSVKLRATGIKEAFTKQDRVIFLGRGENEGRTLARLVDQEVLKSILQPLSSANKMQAGNAETATLDSAIDRLRSTFGEQPDVIILPKLLEIDVNLWDNPNFTPSWRLGHSGSGFAGLYREIPTFSVFSKAPSGILIGYSRNLSASEVTPFTSHISTLTQAQKDEIINLKPDTDAASLDEYVNIECLYEFNLIVSNSEAFLWISVPPKEG